MTLVRLGEGVQQVIDAGDGLGGLCPQVVIEQVESAPSQAADDQRGDIVVGVPRVAVLARLQVALGKELLTWAA